MDALGKIKSAVLTLSLFTMFGCASKYPVTVHLITESMTEPQIRELSTRARRRGGIVQLSAIDQSEPIERPTIVIPHLLADGSIISALQRGFFNLGYEHVDIRYQTLGTHSYTSNDIGVYLPRLTVNDRANYIANLAQTYASECPHFDAELVLFNDGEVLIEVYDIQESGVEFIAQSLKGTWQSTNETLRIELISSEVLSFNVHRVRRENSGRLDLGIILQGQDIQSILSGCNFHSIGYILKNQ